MQNMNLDQQKTIAWIPALHVPGIGMIELADDQVTQVIASYAHRRHPVCALRHSPGAKHDT